MIPPVTLVFTAVFLTLPPILLLLTGKSPRIKQHLWLIAAALAVAVSWLLPSPILSEYTATFSQHLVGGGVSSAFVAYYFIAHMRTPSWRHRLGMVLAVASVLGVANEIVELGMDFVRGTGLRRDASFDLLANTVGAVLAWIGIEAVRRR